MMDHCAGAQRCVRWTAWPSTLWKPKTFRNSSAFGFTVTESAHSKPPSARGRFLFDIIYTFSRTLQQVQSPGLNCYDFHTKIYREDLQNSEICDIIFLCGN